MEDFEIDYTMEQECKVGEGSLYRSSLPYPKIEGIKPSIMYCGLIKPLYSGLNSELTAIMQYFYGSLYMKDSYPKIYEALKNIAVVEMSHLDMLGQLIVALGGDARFTYRSQVQGEAFWTAKAVKYSNTPRKVLLDSISGEEYAIKAYEETAAKIKDEGVSALLIRIAMDERRHLEIFDSLYRGLV